MTKNTSVYLPLILTKVSYFLSNSRLMILSNDLYFYVSHRTDRKQRECVDFVE